MHRASCLEPRRELRGGRCGEDRRPRIAQLKRCSSAEPTSLDRSPEAVRARCPTRCRSFVAGPRAAVRCEEYGARTLRSGRWARRGRGGNGGRRNGFRETAGKSRVQSPDDRDHARSRTRRRTEAVTHRREGLGLDPIRGSGGKGESSEGGGECACGRADSEAAAAAAATPGGKVKNYLRNLSAARGTLFGSCSWIAAPRPRLCPPFLVSADLALNANITGLASLPGYLPDWADLSYQGLIAAAAGIEEPAASVDMPGSTSGAPCRATRSICKTNPCPMSRL